jgi:flagellar biosynthesis protein FlhB
MENNDFMVYTNKAVFIPNNDNLLVPGELLKGEIFYKFDKISYKIKGIESLEQKIKRICLLIIRKNEYAVGLEYEYKKSSAPVVVIKSKNIKELVSMCKKNNIKIVHNKTLALRLYKVEEIDEIISSEVWVYMARIFSKILKKDKDKVFSKRINYA